MQLDASEDTYRRLREDMVGRQIASRGVRDLRVLAAMRAVPRHAFVPFVNRDLAYADTPLPIGHGQTISQPLMVAIMLEALQVQSTDRVLDVGAGSGYQTALLSRLAAEVIAIELVPALAERLGATLAGLGCHNVRVVCGDGGLGYPDASPYDGIIVAAAAPAVPQPLVDQLAPNGRLVIPVGDPATGQELLRVRRGPRGPIREGLGFCSFVPLLGRHGFR